ncbi:hypothetical protein BDR22DRAFT_959693 [Usnea florida]
MANTKSQIKTCLESNRKFAETWKTPPIIEQCVPEQFFGPDCHAAIIRNAGGRATQDVITSITVLRSLMRDAVAVFVIHHTGTHISYLPGSEPFKYGTLWQLTEVEVDCGFKDAKMGTPEALEEIDATEVYGCFSAADFEKTVRIDIETLRSSKVLAGLEIRGLALETETGFVRELHI